MKYVRVGEFQQETLDKLHEYQAKDLFTRSHLAKIDLLLSMVREEQRDYLLSLSKTFEFRYIHQSALF